MKKFISLILAILLLVSVVPMVVSGANAYVINGVTVTLDDFNSSSGLCWDYANNVYKKIWGEAAKYGFSSLFEDENNCLKNLSDDQLLLNEENLKKFISFAPLGACLRVCNIENLHSHDGPFYEGHQPGHNQIIVQKDANGFTVLEGGLTAYPHKQEKYYTWSEYCNTNWLGGRYGYIKYLKWPNAEKYKDEIKTGDIIEFGSYLGETITWICVDVDENGPLMLSKDVLCNKQYDAAGTDSNYHNDGWGYIRKNYGSNCWYDSNIRQWLNSSGTVEYTHCPPTYSNEDGFMSNFSEAELACVKEVTQKTYVNSWETNRSGYVNGGTREVPDVTTVAGLDRDYSYYWYQNVTDSFFLLGQEQLSRIYENNPSYVYNDASYYTRIAGNSGASYEHTFVVFGENTIGASRSSSSNGIRPAFYLDIDKYNSSTNTPSTPQTCKHTNSVNQPQINSNCIDIGFTAGVYCNDCATWLSGHEVIAVGDHKDNTGDGKCDTCLKQLPTPSEPEQPKKNIVQKVVDAVKNAFNNFINFFKKLFGR